MGRDPRAGISDRAPSHLTNALRATAGQSEQGRASVRGHLRLAPHCTECTMDTDVSMLHTGATERTKCQHTTNCRRSPRESALF